MKLLEQINGAVWGIPTMLLIVGAGLYFTIGAGFFQLTWFPRAVKRFTAKLKQDPAACDGVTPYQALCTALAATVGTGNIAGVAGAIALGGPGAVFWMWVCALLGMLIKCAEATLAVYYRHKDSSGETLGGPMYMIEKGLGTGWKPLGCIYAFFGVIAAFGVGNATQINTVLGGIHSSAEQFGFSFGKTTDILLAAGIALVVAFMLCGGGKRIGKAAETLVPYASGLYIVLGVGVLLFRLEAIPNAFHSILVGAFCPRAVTGGVVGSMLAVCRTGAARGIFTNEAGMGTASIAHAGAAVRHPVEQGLMGLIEVFLDTIVICSITALVILCSGVEIPYGYDIGASLTFSAFSSVYGGWSNILITLCLVLFAFATVLGWGLYGLRCAQYLFGRNGLPAFIVLQAATVVLGAVLETKTVWLLAESVNGLMAVPNLIALMMLSPVFFKLIREYKSIY